MKKIKQTLNSLGVVIAMIVILGTASCSENGRGSKKITTTEWKEYDGNFIKAAFPDSSFMYFQVMDESHVRLVSSNKKYGYVTYSGDLEIPGSITSNGKKYQVSSIGEALRGSNVTSVVIPKTVTALDNNAFDNCQELKSVQLSEGLVSIGDYAFADCKSLTSLTVPKTVKNLGKEVLYGCANLTNLVLPDGLSMPKSESKLKGYEWLEGVWAGAEGPDSFGRVIVTESYYQVVNSNMDNTFDKVEEMPQQDYILKLRQTDYDGYDDDGEVFGFNNYLGVDVNNQCIYIIQGEYQSIILHKIQEDNFEAAVFKANNNYPQKDEIMVVIDDQNNCVGEYKGTKGNNYMIFAQDDGEVPISGHHIVIFSAKNGQGVVYTYRSKVNVRALPSTNSAVVAVMPSVEEAYGLTFPCLGKVEGWYKISIDGKVGYVREDLVIWNAIDTF